MRTCWCVLPSIHGPGICDNCSVGNATGEVLTDPFTPTQLGPQEHAHAPLNWRLPEHYIDRMIEQNDKIIELLEELIKLGTETKKLLS